MLKRFSLVKQLLIVFGLLALSFFIIINPLLDKNINDIIEIQMFERLESSQHNLTSYNFFQDDKQIHSIVYHSTTNTFTYNNFNSKGDALTDIYTHLIGNDLNTIVKDSKHTTIQNSGKFRRDTYYYRIIALDDSDYYLISFLRSDYLSTLTSNIRNRIIYIQYAFLALTALILIVWVLSLIKPLNKIKLYVEAIGRRENMTLNIDREDEIGVVSRALVHMKEDLDKQEKVKEEMIHNISHDLKTPIALIKTYGQSVKDDIYPYGDKETSMDIILENADRLETKVKDLLYLNRLDYLDSEDVQGHPINMKELLEHIVTQMDALNDLQLQTDLTETTFIGEEDHWRIAIENIIDNASRYAKNKIIITLKDNYLEIYNDGEHIDASTLEDLFDPYVKGVKGQFGLGLSISYKTASLYGYTLEAKNQETGVSFIFKK